MNVKTEDQSLIGKKGESVFFLYLILGGLFIATLVTCNLIANKFVTVDLGFYTFVVSAGVLPYPITFLITDILSEIYGSKRTNQVVYAGFFALVLVLFILWLGNQFPSIEGSIVDDVQYESVFANSWRIILASMVAYLVAQVVDVRIFHFWKKRTKGKYLWLRNNFSTIFSQWVDTTLVICVLFIGVKPMDVIFDYILMGWLFKIVCALFDTPLFYLFTKIIQKKLGLQPNEEVVFSFGNSIIK